LIIEDLVVGAGNEVTPGAKVRMHYVGRLRDGTVFDSSRERNVPMEVEVGNGYLIKGFEEGVMGMRVGGKRRLVIPPELGYGDHNVGGKIPANATLEFEVEVLEIL
jgi:FKBP-type peptidyl-prolyl cis-trans isomerase